MRMNHPALARLTEIAHTVLKQVPGAAFDGEPFILPGISKVDGTPFLTANCFYHTVLFVGPKAMVFSNEAGGMVPYFQHEASDTFSPNPNYHDINISMGSDVAQEIAQTLLPCFAAQPEVTQTDEAMAIQPFNTL